MFSQGFKTEGFGRCNRYPCRVFELLLSVVKRDSVWWFFLSPGKRKHKQICLKSWLFAQKRVVHTLEGSTKYLLKISAVRNHVNGGVRPNLFLNSLVNEQEWTFPFGIGTNLLINMLVDCQCKVLNQVQCIECVRYLVEFILLFRGGIDLLLFSLYI